MKDLFDLQEKVIVVTGGLGRLGLQFARELAERRARVVVLDLAAEEASLPYLFAEAPFRDRVLVLRADVTERISLEAALEKLSARWEIPHALINCAALDSPPNASGIDNGPFEDYPESSWDKVIEVNLKGVFLCCQVFGGKMAEAGRGSIVNISSIYGVVSPDQRIYEYRAKGGTSFYKPVAYSASKSGLLNLTRYLATYWAGSGVRVNTLTLAGVYDSQDEAFLRSYCARIPVARMAREDEYNGAVVFLCSDASSYMTGSNLVIDGGWTAW